MTLLAHFKWSVLLVSAWRCCQFWLLVMSLPEQFPVSGALANSAVVSSGVWTLLLKAVCVGASQPHANVSAYLLLLWHTYYSIYLLHYESIIHSGLCHLLPMTHNHCGILW